MDLNTLANIAEITGAIIVVGGLWFAIVQLLQYRQQRRDMAAIELARSFQNPAFARALRLVLALPDGVSTEELRGCDPTCEDAAIQLSLTLEAVGILVYKRMIDLDIAWELLGGVAIDAWDKLNVWIETTGAEQEQPKFDEWFEWLVIQIRRHKVRPGVQPAHVLYRDWEPRGS